MSQTDKGKLVDRVVRLFDSRLQLDQLFIRNAAARHGVPMTFGGEPVPMSVEQRETVVERTQQKPPDEQVQSEPAPQQTPAPSVESGWLRSFFSKPLVKFAATALLGASGLGVPLAIYNYLTAEEAPAAIETDKTGSIFQYLEDLGFHKPDEQR